MSAGANVRHLTGLILAAVGGILSLVLGLSFAMMGAMNREPGAYACAAVAVLAGGFCIWRGIKMRNRAAKESTMFKDETTDTWTSVTGKGRAPYRKDPPPGDDW